MAKRLISPVLTDAFVPQAQTQLSTYPYHWVNAMSARFGRLIPVLCEEVLPKDHWKGSAYPFVRLEPLIKPVLAEANVFLHFFFIPNRILWSGWEDFIAGLDSERAEPYFKTADAVPFKESMSYLFQLSSLSDYLGFNATMDEMESREIDEDVLLFPWMAYQCVYDHWYRNKNFEPDDRRTWDWFMDNAHDGVYDFEDDPLWLSGIMQIHNRDWEPDYFTTSLPWPQRHEDVLIPFTPTNDLSVQLDPNRSSDQLIVDANGDPFDANFGSTGAAFLGYQSASGAFAAQDTDLDSGVAMRENSVASLDPNGTYKVPVSGLVNTSTIEDLRVARILQSFREIEGYADNDYQGQIEGLFGIRIPDYRIDKPELIGGGRQPITISEVLQTSASEDGSAQGNLAGHAVSVPQQAFFEYRAYEHGWILGLMSIMPRTSYFQGLHRKFSRFNRFDYAWPQFATLGAQEVKNREIFMSDDGDGTFGYQPRYMEYKTHASEVHGSLKGDEDFWTLSRKFSETPVLGPQFLNMDHSDVDDVFAVQDGSDPMQVMIKFKVECSRALPYRTQPLI